MICETLLALSFHWGLVGNYNHYHPVGRCEIKYNTHIGAYYNSERRLSLYSSKTKTYKYFDVEYGLVTGYSKYKVLPLLRFKKNNWFIAPMYEKNSSFLYEYPPYKEIYKSEKNFGFVIGYEVKVK
jgi:hypothetical protein